MSLSFSNLLSLLNLLNLSNLLSYGSQLFCISHPTTALQSLQKQHQVPVLPMSMWVLHSFIVPNSFMEECIFKSSTTVLETLHTTGHD